MRNHSESYETIISTAGIDPGWDDFVLRTPTAPHEQTSLWGDCQRLAGWSAQRLMVKQNGVVVGGAQILDRPIGSLGWTIGYLNRGPLVASEDPRLQQVLFESIKKHARRKRMMYLAVILPYDGSALHDQLLAAGFTVSPEALPPTTTMMSTIILDLALDTEQLLMQMRTSTRQNIRKALRSELAVRQGGPDDLPAFQELLASLCARRGVRSNVPSNGFVEDLWARFAPQGMLRMFLVEAKGAPVAAMLVFTTGAWFRVWRTGWSGKFAKHYPTELIYWEAIKWAKASGYEFFDFVGFDTRYAEALVRGRALPEAEICRASFFKQGFGGQVERLNPKYCYFSNPLIRFVFAKFGAGIVNTQLFMRIASRTAART